MVLHLTDSISQYIVRRFRESIDTREGNGTTPIGPTEELPATLLVDADRIVTQLVLAYRNPKLVQISAAELLKMLRRNDYGKNVRREEALLDLFPPGDPEVLEAPALIIDKAGIVVAWYLPGAISAARQEHIMYSMGLMSNAFAKSYNCVGTSWRQDKDLFNPKPCIKGCLNMSPGWFQLGHGGGDNCPEVSATLKASNASCGGREWLDANAETNALLAGAMAIMHPELYQAGRATMESLPRIAIKAGVEEIEEVVAKWESVFNVVSAMMNREAPYHRDHNSPGASFDLLLTFGDYQKAWMSIPTLGKWFHYGPGTLMAFSGFLLRHGVNGVTGNRGCLAYYMRPEVMQWAGIPPPEFMRYALLEATGLTLQSRRVYGIGQ